MTDPINIFILAAGLGERLLPITSCIPKPLLPIAGTPLLQITLQKVSGLPLRGIGINLHHKRDVLDDWISRSDFRTKITIFPEDRILGTGGGLKNAEGFLSRGEFIVHNADILSDIDLEGLVDLHRSSENLATLAVHDFAKFNTVAVDSRGFLRGVGQLSGEKRVAFTGIGVYNPEFLKFLPRGASSVVDAWMAAVASGFRIGTFDVSGSYWKDIGTPPAYAAAVIDRMRSEGETVFIHPSAEGCRNARIDGYVIVEEQCRLPEGVSTRNCLVLPETRLNENTHYENCIIGPDFAIPLAEEEILSSEDAHILPIGAGGSERKYFRIRREGSSSVLMKFSGLEADFDRHITYTEFFGRYGVPVPTLLRADEERTEALFEDLGDLSLYSWLKCKRSEGEIEAIYGKVIDIAVIMHTELTGHISECPLLKERIFDYDYLRWETRYFMENFVSLIRNIRPNGLPQIEKDFRRLARQVDSSPKTVMHRDFQSQNVMLTKGETPRLIDYQGARIGPPAYDIASLLWDPYSRLKQALRERLLDYYIHRMKERVGTSFEEGPFREILLPCRLQRHMQALGAYGFLSSVKDKKYFLKHAAEGVRLLREDAALAKDRYPAIYELTLRL